MSKKVIILGDTHFGARNDNSDVLHFQQAFFEEVLFPYMEEHGIKHIIQVGDIFDRRKYINFLTLHLFKMFFFDYLRTKDITLDVIIGNHDSYFKNTLEVNSPELLLKEYDNIRVFRECEIVDRNGCNFLMIPWICQDNQEFIMDRVANAKAQVAIGHLELDGFEMYKGQPKAGGMDPAFLEKFEIVMSGHFHHKSTIGNIHYVGAPYELVWSDANDQRGFHVFDCGTRELEYVQNPLNLFFKIRYNDEGKSIDDYKDLDFTPYKGAFIKIVVINKTDPFIFDYLIDQLEKVGVNDIQVVEDHHHKDDEPTIEIVLEADDTLTIMNKHVDNITTSDNADKLKILFQELYNKAQQAS